MSKLRSTRPAGGHGGPSWANHRRFFLAKVLPLADSLHPLIHLLAADRRRVPVCWQRHGLGEDLLDPVCIDHRVGALRARGGVQIQPVDLDGSGPGCEQPETVPSGRLACHPRRVTMSMGESQNHRLHGLSSEERALAEAQETTLGLRPTFRKHQHRRQRRVRSAALLVCDDVGGRAQALPLGRRRRRLLRRATGGRRRRHLG
mmetsp:Transcript_8038/g.23068  ORF Transcript_8038/g.23068 Transcript_8038/m.23068 type:complete len:203 (-) Transcript_8038:96-704(-)